MSDQLIQEADGRVINISANKVQWNTDNREILFYDDGNNIVA